MIDGVFDARVELWPIYTVYMMRKISYYDYSIILCWVAEHLARVGLGYG
jgi:hypothetical protein